MNIALLFNSDDPSFGGYYGPPVMSKILEVGVLQEVDRQMRVSTGDILTFGVVQTRSELVALCKLIYSPKKFDRLIQERLSATHGNSTVYCWLFQNMTAATAERIHLALAADITYLGAMDVEFADRFHLHFFRNSLPERYRLKGKHCAIFYCMGENEDPDIAEQEAFEKFGFFVEYEDAGARQTIFDNYDTLEHFARVDDFNRVFSRFAGLSEDQASELTITLEELHPKLFDAFASAARALERAETEEDLAQAALSGRRVLEKIADYLFPPQDETWKGRKVGISQYRNRLWAYIDQTATEVGLNDPTILSSLGKEADRLVELFNAGLHSDPTREKVEEAFRDLALWLGRVIGLSPSHARRPYLAYEAELQKVFVDLKDDLLPDTDKTPS